jgi:hypothetical protein
MASLLLPMALLIPRPATAADEQVGVNSAVNPAGTGTPPSGPTRQLMIGQDVVFKERVDTTSVGQTQIMFLDESSMSVGPNSDMVIDEFVYDPKANTGKLAMSATRGVFRYVGGKISKLEGGVTVDTPVASIGIRGGAFGMTLVPGAPAGKPGTPSQGTTATFTSIYGALHINVKGRIIDVLRPGYAVVVNPDGIVIGPFKVTPESTAAMNVSLDGRPGGNGGAINTPTDSYVAVSGIGNVVSAPFEKNLLAALKAAGFTCRGAIGLKAIANRLTIRCDTSDDPGDLQTAMLENSGIKPGVRLVNNKPQPAPGPYAGSFNSVPAGSSTGFTDPPTTFQGGTLQNGVLTTTIDGQTVTLGPFTAGSTTTVTGQGPFGAVTGTGFLTSDGGFFYANLSGSGQVALIQGGIPITNPATTIGAPSQVLAFNVQQDPALRSAIPFIPGQHSGRDGIAALSRYPIGQPYAGSVWR